ncbi:MAG: beta-1,3-glucanase family protein [Candidatus Eremiobacteraeota bacterium]|nr:beta-1,3-glucanase family protein [Candidatus Eremiobacteraeota bacterium]
MNHHSQGKAIVILFAALILLFTTAGCGTSTSGDSAFFWGNGSTTAATSTVSGKIVSPFTLQPLQGVSCTLEAVSGSSYSASTALTDSQGAYSFSGVPSGSYRLTTKKEGNITDAMYFTVTQDMVINVISMKNDEWMAVMGTDHPYDATMAYVSAVIDSTGGGTLPIPSSAASKEAGRDKVLVDLFSAGKAKGSGYQSRSYMDAQGKADWNATSTSTRGTALFYKVKPADTYTMTAVKAGKTIKSVTVTTPAQGQVTNYLMTQQDGGSGLPITISNQSGTTAYVFFTGTSVSVDPPATDCAHSVSIASNSSQVFNLASISAGRIYVSYGQALSTDSPDGANSGDPDYNTRFDKVEITYTPTSVAGNFTGTADLTAVDFFAIPFVLQTSIQGTTITQLSLAQGQTATTLNAALANLAPSAVVTNPATSTTVRILSPSKCPAPYQTFDSLLNSMNASTSFTISGTYYGTQSSNYSFTGSVQGSGKSGTIALQDANSNNLTIAMSSLMYDQTDLINHNGIYTCNGSFTANGATEQVSANDVFAAVYRDLVTGFNLGFVTAGSNQSSGWWSQAPFQSGTTYNQYAQVISTYYPGAYGFPFSDRYKSVLASLGSSNNCGVDGMTITILGDTASPPSFSYSGTVDPQSGSGPTFTISITTAQSILNIPYTFDQQAYQGGLTYTFPSTQVSYGPQAPNSAEVTSIPTTNGLNIYNLVFSQMYSYQVLVYVANNQIQWATIAGGGNSTWSPGSGGGGVLFIGGVLD